jgi:hypothetical protein
MEHASTAFLMLQLPRAGLQNKPRVAELDHSGEHFVVVGQTVSTFLPRYLLQMQTLQSKSTVSVIDELGLAKDQSAT